MAVFGNMSDRGEPLTEGEIRRVNWLVSRRSPKPSFSNENCPLMPSDPSFEADIKERVIGCLDRYMGAAKLNWQELAGYVGVSDRTIRNWRSDAHKACSMDAETCERLTQRLFISLDWLRYGIDHMPDGDSWDSSIVEWYYLKADPETKADVCRALRRGAEIQRLGRELENVYEGLDPLVEEIVRLRGVANT